MSVVDNFRGLTDLFSAASPDTGDFFFPDNGTYDCLITAAAINPAGKAKVGAVEIPATEITFNYKLTVDPDSKGEPRSFRGKPFYLPTDPAAYAVAAGKKANQFQIDLNRLAGHCKTLLDGDESFKLSPDLIALAVQKAAGAAAVVKVKCETREYNITAGPRAGQKGKDRSEHLLALLSK